MSERDYYTILGIAPDANYEAVDAAYWLRVREARARPALEPQGMSDLNEAYEVLRTPSLRHEYNAHRAQAASLAPEEPAEPPAVSHAGIHHLAGALKPRLPWGRQAEDEQAAATALLIEQLERGVHGDRERMRAGLEAEFGTPDDGAEDRARLMRVFGLLPQS